MKKMEDLESGFEEMQGVKLGYLVIKGKQMFALSQVFTDLLKNIPRTTVHKRMDHLNVKKHHCDLEELRKLKAINSIAFHAAKCTLISREDVEALYFSCKTERVLKSNKRREKTKTSEKTCEDNNHTAARSDFWREKVWLSLHSVPQTFSFKKKAARQDSLPHTHSNLPQIYSTSFARDFQPVTKSASTPFKNYETAQIHDNCVAFNQKHAFIRHVVNRQPLLYQSAIAAQSKHQGNADLLYKRKRKRERQFWARSRRSHPVLVVPKCCKPKVPNGSLAQFHHIEHGLYVDPRHTGHFQESCSSDTESSSISERVNNDSDFGSSFSTTSNSGTSDEEEDDSLSDSSDVSSDEESSSQSDSSSVSSQVSVQSIRFRRARFSSLNTKAPLLLQPTFHYRPNFQNIPANQDAKTILDCQRAGKTQKLDFSTPFKDRRKDGDAANVQKFCLVGACFPDAIENGGSERVSRLEFSSDSKTSESIRIKEIGLTPIANGNKAFPQQRIPGSAKKCPQALVSHCVSDKGITVCKSSDSNLSLAANSKREAKTSPKLHSPLKPIKTEVEETTGSNHEAVKTPPFLLNNVKVKVEDTFDEYEYVNQFKDNDADAKAIHFKETDHCKDAIKATESSVQKHPACNEESKSTLSTPCSEEGECKNAARARRNYRTMLMGKKAERASSKSSAKVDRSPRSAGKFAMSEGSNEDCVGSSKRKRASTNVASVKKPFSFMANFTSPPSLVIGRDGDLSPAYSLNSLKSKQLPHRSHPVWRWQLGHSVVPPSPSHKFRKASVIP